MNSNSFIAKGGGDQPLAYNSTIDESTLNEVPSENSELTPKLSEKLNDCYDHRNTHSESFSNDDSPKKKRKKRSLLDDDFFSLAGSFEKRKKKHKHKHKHKQIEKEKEQGVQDQQIQNYEVIEDLAPQLTTVLTEKGFFNELASSQSDIPRKKGKTFQPEKSQLRSVSITPPLVDKNKIRNEVMNRLNKEHMSSNIPDIEDSEEESDHELEELLKLKSQMPKSQTESSPEIYTFDDESEKKRKYIVRVTSKLPAVQNQILEVDFGTKGLKTFEKILKAAVDYFRSALALVLTPPQLLRYRPEAASLVWVEGRKLVHPFFTPKTLRVPPPAEFNPLFEKIENMKPTIIKFFLIPKEYDSTFMHIYPELQANQPIEAAIDPIEISENEFNSNESDDDEEEEEEEIVAQEEQPTSKPASSEEPVGSNLFVIGLKGKDNKRVEVKVSPETQLRKLLSYYLRHKRLSEDTVDLSKAKLIFDDEEMDLNDTVGDTELEEDYEIQIVL